jgi:hypothetical protein
MASRVRSQVQRRFAPVRQRVPDASARRVEQVFRRVLGIERPVQEFAAALGSTVGLECLHPLRASRMDHDLQGSQTAHGHWLTPLLHEVVSAQIGLGRNDVHALAIAASSSTIIEHATILYGALFVFRRKWPPHEFV